MNLKDVMRYSLSCPTFSREICKKDPDPWQITAMTSPSKRLIFLCSRQAGKSTVAAIISLHRALFYPNSMILLVSKSLRQSGLLFQKVASFYKLVPDQPRLDEDNKTSMRLKNGSWIVSVPGTEETIRGFSGVDLIIEDEAARVKDELYFSIRPMLATSNGKLILMSTPFGNRGHFHDEFVGTNEWERIMIPAPECPRITPEFLEEEKQSMGAWWFSQEYLCEFKDTTDSLFRYDHIQAALSNNHDAWFAEETW